MNNEIMLNAVVLYFTYGKRSAALNVVTIRHSLLEYDAELLNVSIRRIRLFSRILLHKKNRRKFNL